MAATLKALDRNTTKRSELRVLREEKEGLPAVLYGKDRSSAPVSVDALEFIKIYREVGKNGVIELDFEGQGKYPVMVYDMQVDHLKNQIMHVDFYSVDLDKEVEAEVPVHLKGTAQGDKDGGVVQQMLHEITVKAKPNDFPDSIEIDISELNIGDAVLVSDLPKGNKYEVTADGEEPIASVVPPTKEPVEDEEEADEVAEEPPADEEETDDETTKTE
ncbi:50S ribosomal protein L25/general stress protein Ctc [Guptibacillus algicola]|uniref:50S ribosomal protein L25/general stress protein Ctc n=1 Tax=Guptibacillus algicola TaxID=225844 RepID=UPI001CD4E589|nr:50S ribosomal protein L25/general stress protein Ctc [Alkalihalobacillus algicola]MCA0989565.1 50S ribosomal protein L25/general stress protein Ctc [Alkalihalobacillus algicola]